MKRIIAAALLAGGLIVAVASPATATKTPVTICHNVDHNPTEITVDDDSVDYTAHAAHIEKGKDILGPCPVEETPDTTVPPTTEPPVTEPPTTEPPVTTPETPIDPVLPEEPIGEPEVVTAVCYTPNTPYTVDGVPVAGWLPLPTETADGRRISYPECSFLVVTDPEPQPEAPAPAPAVELPESLPRTGAASVILGIIGIIGTLTGLALVWVSSPKRSRR